MSHISSPSNVSHVSLNNEMQWQGKLDDFLTIQQKIAEGLYGPVYKAKFKNMNATVAAKRVYLNRNQDTMKTVMKEVESLRKLSHENIVAYYGAYPFSLSSSNSAELWILTGYEAGGSLSDLIKQRGSLPEAAVATIVTNVLYGLAYLNSHGLVHRNIRSNNILLSPNGLPKISDFGLAKALSLCGARKSTATKKSKASIYWQPPEYILEEECTFTESYDTWSVGMIIHEMCDTKNPLTTFNSLKVIVVLQGLSGKWRRTLTFPKQWSPDLNNFLEKCLIDDPASRKPPKEMLQEKWIESHKHYRSTNIIQPLLEKRFSSMSLAHKSYHQKMKFDFDKFWEPEPVPVEASSIFTEKQLIEYITTGDRPVLENGFALCYQSYMEGETLLNLLIRRFRGTSGGSPDPQVQKSVATILESWISLNSTELLGLLGREVLSLIAVFSQFRHYLSTSAVKKLELLQDPPPMQDISAWINSHQQPDFSTKNNPELLALSPRDLAEQMTLIESKIMQRIEPAEFHKQAWNKKGAEIKAPWLSFYIDWFNQRSRWFTTLILKEENLKERIGILEKLIDTLDEFFKLQNFNGALEVSACLFSSPIMRLKQTWAGISERHHSSIKNAEDLLSPISNYKRYRELLKKCKPPCLPYIGLFLTDLTFTDETHKDRVDGAVNLKKIEIVGSILNNIYSLTQTDFNIKENQRVSTLIVSGEPWDEQDFFNISRLREDNSNESDPSLLSRQLPLGKENVWNEGDFTPQDEKLLISAASQISFRPGEKISEHSTGLFRIRSGTVKVSRVEADQHVDVELLKSGDWFGEFTFFGTKDIKFSYTTCDSVTVDFLAPDLMTQLLRSHPHLSRRFWKRIATLLVQALKQNFQKGSKAILTREQRAFSSPVVQATKDTHEGVDPASVELAKVLKLPPSQVPNIIVLKKFVAEMEHSKGRFFISKNLLAYSGYVFGMNRKEIILVPHLKAVEIHEKKPNTLRLRSAASKIEIRIPDPHNLEEAINLIRSLMKTSDTSTSRNNLLESLQSAPKDPEDVQVDSLQNSDWKLILQGLKSKKYQKDEPILLEGAIRKQRIFQVASGCCRLQKNNSSGHIIVLGRATEGQIFGEISFLSPGDEAISVIAETETEIIKLEGYFLQLLFERHETLGGKFFRFLASTLIERIQQKQEFITIGDQTQSPKKARRSLKDPKSLVRRKN